MSPGEEAARNFVATLNDVILFPLIALLMGVAFLVFIWGCFEYIQGANNVTAREQGVKHITYGIIGLVIMISAWAILSLAAATFGLDDDLEDLGPTGMELVEPLV
jgi:TRAP-type C4-dicarboxylate transport system permease small subunit